jgi:hypothetical protein
MLHWSSWWSHSTHDSAASTAPSPNDPEPWDHENAVRLQTRFWEQWLDAQRSWWTMVGGVLPSMAAAKQEDGKPREAAKPDSESASEPAHHKHSAGIERRWPVASGPAAAKLKQQRKRAGLKPNQTSR